MFKNILVPVDGSDYSLAAAQTAVKMAETHQSTITLLHIVNHSQLLNMGSPLPQSMPLVTDVMISGLNEVGHKTIEGILEKLGPLTVPVETEVTWGNAAQVIVDLANEHICDLIIMGSRGLSPISGMLMGSVSDRVVQLAKCPVMVIKK